MIFRIISNAGVALPLPAIGLSYKTDLFHTLFAQCMIILNARPENRKSVFVRCTELEHEGSQLSFGLGLRTFELG